MKKESLILLHGALGSSAQLEPLVPWLQDDFKVYSLDFTGHGGSRIPDEFTIDCFATDVIQLMDEANIIQAHIFGFSMGGYVGLKVAERMGMRIGKIITLGTKFDWNPKTASEEISRLDPVTIERKVPAFATFLEKRHAPADWKEVLQKTADMMIRLGDQPQWVPGNNDVANNVCLMVGSLDKMVSADETRKVADALQNGTFKILEGVDHPMEKADPRRIAYEIKEFIL